MATICVVSRTWSAKPHCAVEHAKGHGDKMFAAVCRLGLKGIVSKKLNAPVENLD
jgi:ATP-dependent DNA ligase